MNEIFMGCKNTRQCSASHDKNELEYEFIKDTIKSPRIAAILQEFFRTINWRSGAKKVYGKYRIRANALPFSANLKLAIRALLRNQAKIMLTSVGKS